MGDDVVATLRAGCDESPTLRAAAAQAAQKAQARRAATTPSEVSLNNLKSESEGCKPGVGAPPAPGNSRADLRERYAAMPQARWFREAHQGRSFESAA